MASLPPQSWPWVRPAVELDACMDSADLRLWEEMNDRLQWPDHRPSPCRDCTAAFAAEMLFEGRCHGRPGSDVFPGELLALRRWEAA